ncbi:hypothetical protein KC358_g62 [Hortaea werneckii]|nr:hypothetical protein KC358_g62 [Hortaea werneckii]
MRCRSLPDLSGRFFVRSVELTTTRVSRSLMAARPESTTLKMLASLQLPPASLFGCSQAAQDSRLWPCYWDFRPPSKSDGKRRRRRPERRINAVHLSESAQLQKRSLGAKYLTSNPLLVNISRLNCMLKGGRLHCFAVVVAVSSASALKTNSLWPVKRAMRQTMQFSAGSYLALPWLARWVVEAVLRGVGMRTSTLVAKSLGP